MEKFDEKRFEEGREAQAKHQEELREQTEIQRRLLEESERRRQSLMPASLSDFNRAALATASIAIPAPLDAGVPMAYNWR